MGFSDKPCGDGAWVNGGFLVLSPEVGRYIARDATIWQQEPMRGLAADGERPTYRHTCFWQPIDTVRERNVLVDLARSGCAPWQTWAYTPTSGAGAVCSSPA
jgi:glucose-1-phosphate cytidylyltransferase